MTLIEISKECKSIYDNASEDGKLNAWCQMNVLYRDYKFLKTYAIGTLVVGGIVLGCKIIDKIDDLISKHKNVVAYTEESE